LLTLNESQWLLKSLTLAPNDELYLLDAANLDLIYLNELAKRRLAIPVEDWNMSHVGPQLGVPAPALLAYIEEQRNQTNALSLSVPVSALLQDVNHSPLRVMLILSGDKEFILVTKNDMSLNEKVVMALNESESRFQAIVSNIPGLVFQAQMTTDDALSFVYLSDGCEALLGMTAEELEDNGGLLFSIMNARDRGELRERLMESAQSLKNLDWDGRVWIDGWQDTKWINLRATVRKLDDGVVQWDGIMVNITQSKLEKQQIEQSRRDLEQLTAHMNNIKEQERTAIAREIHDDLGGNLTAIKMGLASMAQQIMQGQLVTVEQTTGLEAIVNRTFEAVHRISGNLRPNILDLGIVDALEWQVNQFKKQVGLEAVFKTNRSEIHVSNDQAMALFRICQESLSNVAKYAKATKVKVELMEINDEVSLIVQDNGVGIQDVDKLKANSYGLRGMQERVSALHGDFRIGYAEGMNSGTQIKAVIPI